ncbi:hypothetical protein F4604DRAFT_1936452 [Suillus subluteus]|nr:hypothetical protein F4604DRAFT_1936452 [Suillus subluteus]
MSCPKTHPGNADKHPGKIVQDANKVRRSKEEVAAEKGRKQAEKDTRAAAVEKAHTKIAAAEDAMAVEQSVEVDGPPKLVQPRPRMSDRPRSVQGFGIYRVQYRLRQVKESVLDLNQEF